MYEAVLRAATGRSDFQFKVTNHAFPITALQKEHEDVASGIFVCFVVGIGFSLIPASIASMVVGERQNSIKSIQVIKGIYMSSYWIAFTLVDLIRAYLPCLATIALIDLFNLEYGHVWKVIMLYPLAIIPFTYVTSYFFRHSATAQTFTLYVHFLLSGIAGMIVFALRMVQDTALWGDRAMWFMRLASPSFNLCNSIIFASSAEILKKQRDTIIKDLGKLYKAQGLPGDQLQARLPTVIRTTKPLEPDNIGGDIVALGFLAIFWTLAFIFIEAMPNGFWTTCKKRLTLRQY